MVKLTVRYGKPRDAPTDDAEIVPAAAGDLNNSASVSVSMSVAGR